MILIVNRDYFLEQHQQIDLGNDEVLCFLWGTDWILKYHLDELRLEILFDLWAGLPYNGSLPTQCDPRWPYYCDGQGLRPTGVSDCMPLSFTCPDGHHVTDILSKPTGPPRLHTNGLGRIPGLPWRQTLGEFRCKRREAINKCVEELTSAIQGASDPSAPKPRPCVDSRPPLPASIKDEIRLKNRLKRRWQVTRDPAMKARANRLQRSVTYRLNDWRNKVWSGALESLDGEDQSLRKMTKRVMRVPIPSSPCESRKD
jgi:hypothetical protein